jgi:hypothetical protein
VRDQNKRGEHKKVSYCDFIGIGVEDFVKNIGIVLEKFGDRRRITTFKYGSWKENKESQEEEVPGKKRSSNAVLSELTP